MLDDGRIVIQSMGVRGPFIQGPILRKPGVFARVFFLIQYILSVPM